MQRIARTYEHHNDLTMTPYDNNKYWLNAPIGRSNLRVLCPRAHAAVFALRLPHVAHSSLPAFPEGKKEHHACSRCFSRPRVQLVVATNPTVVHAELHRSHASAVHDLALV